jgi:sulfoxide reductase heme-binding subunit YedZ
MNIVSDRINRASRRVPKWAVYLAGVLPFAWLVWQLFTGGLGIDPVKGLEHELGELGLKFLIGSLAVTPLMKYARINLVKFRRVLGLLTFFYISMHLSTWLLLDMQLLWAEILKDLTKRPYIVIGMAAFTLLVPLAVTSNDWSVRKMGGVGWRRLHKVVYAAVILGATHNVMVQKVWEIEPLVYLGVIGTLLAIRLKPRRTRVVASVA